MWPNAVIHTCEGHLRRLLLDRLPADGQPPTSDFAYRAGAALADPVMWAAFVADANAAGLAHTSHWLAGKDRPMRRQFASRQPDRPYSNGATETVFAITKRLWTRRFVFRNRARLELALARMLLDLEGSADELRYREAIRKALLAGGGQPAKARRSLDDRGGSSIHAEVRRHRADGGEAGAEREAREGGLRPEQGCRHQPDSAPPTRPAHCVEVTVKHPEGRSDPAARRLWDPVANSSAVLP